MQFRQEVFEALWSYPRNGSLSCGGTLSVSFSKFNLCALCMAPVRVAAMSAGYFIIPLSSKNSTGSLSLPCSHINEKNQILLSPIQKSAGVKVMLESTGFLSLSGVYSACQPKISPCQYLPRECK